MGAPPRICVWALSAYNNDFEGAGQHLRSRAWVVGRGSGTRAEFRSYEVDAISRGIVGHGAGATFGGERLDGFVVGTRRVDDREDAFAARSKGQIVFGAPACGIGAVADFGIREDFAGAGIDDTHL